MYKFFLTITTIGFLVLGIACISGVKPPVKNETSTQPPHHEESVEAIVLNNGEKWKVDAEMLVYIRNMESEINSFSSEENKDYMSLAKSLQANIDLLTSNCTMTGQAHDELHKWLLPYIDLVNELSKAQNNQEADKRFLQIQTSFTIFNQYFQ